MRTCNDCGRTKKLADFYTSKHDPSGRAPICRPCSRHRARITNRALSMLRDRYYAEYMDIRKSLMTQAVTSLEEDTG